MSPHRKSHNLLYNLLIEKNKPPQEMVNKRGVPFGPTWLTRTLVFEGRCWFSQVFTVFKAVVKFFSLTQFDSLHSLIQ